MIKAREQIERIGLDKCGITSAEAIFQNLSYDELFKHETELPADDPARGIITKLGAVAIDTGRFTGRSPKDKYIVKQSDSAENVWWAGTGSDNTPLSESAWRELKNIAVERLNGRTKGKLTPEVVDERLAAAYRYLTPILDRVTARGT